MPKRSGGQLLLARKDTDRESADLGKKAAWHSLGPRPAQFTSMTKVLLCRPKCGTTCEFPNGAKHCRGHVLERSIYDNLLDLCFQARGSEGPGPVPARAKKCHEAMGARWVTKLSLAKCPRRCRRHARVLREAILHEAPGRGSERAQSVAERFLGSLAGDAL